MKWHKIYVLIIHFLKGSNIVLMKFPDIMLLPLEKYFISGKDCCWICARKMFGRV